MKLRIKGNAVRYRITQSELAKLITDGRVEDTVHLGPGEESKFTYTLEQSEDLSATTLQYRSTAMTIVIPSQDAQKWAHSNEVGIYASIDLGLRGELNLLVEKDFACLDLSDADNLDTFPNPHLGAVC
jgi:hypothetical protein